MPLTQFKTWMLLCALLPIEILAQATETDEQIQYQTCSNNTWCITFDNEGFQSNCTMDCGQTCEHPCNGNLSCQNKDLTWNITASNCSTCIVAIRVTVISPSCPILSSPSQTPFITAMNSSPNITSMESLGVVTGILLVSLVIVIAGWVWTCVRMRSPRPPQSHTDKHTQNTVSRGDTDMEENGAYGRVTSHTDYIIYENESFENSGTYEPLNSQQ